MGYYVVFIPMAGQHDGLWPAPVSTVCSCLCRFKQEYKDLQVQATATFMFSGLVRFHNGWAAKKRLADLCVSSVESEIDGLKKAATSYRGFHKASSAAEQVHNDKCFQEPVKLLACNALS